MMMKKNILILLAIIFPFFLLAQETGETKNDTIINYLDIQGNKQGKWIDHYSNGQIRYEGFFIDDIPQGTFIHYHSNGRKKSVLNYNDDGSSTVEMFWESGHKAARGAYNSDRERTGLWKLYYTEGSLLQIINYKNGKADGEVTMYYPGTNVKLLDCNYKNAKLDGDYVKYFNNGLKMEEGKYINGLKHGLYTYFTSDGFIQEQGYYEYGKRVGEWFKYTKGEISDTVNYIDGRPENSQELMQEWYERSEWAKENQDKFRDPHDYFDNPYEFFIDRPDPYEQEQKKAKE